MTRSPSTESPVPKSSFMRTGLSLLLSVVLLSLAADPVGLWFLAWFALAPWLVAIGEAPTMRAALARGWLAGIAYFAINLWWLWTASIPGTAVLVVYFALYWALAAGLIHGLQLLNSSDSSGASASKATFSIHSGLVLSGRVVTVAFVWVAVEWLRCNVASGFAWLPLGCTQSPLIGMCQVADFGGPWIVSWWVALPSAWLAIAWFERTAPRRLIMPAALVAAILACVAGYGIWRLQSTTALDGPRIMVIQTNFPHLPGGAPSIDRQRSVDLLLRQIESSISGQPDLVVLPEASLPPINDEARRELAKSPIGPFLYETHNRLLAIASKHQTSLLVGGSAVTGWSTHGKEHIGSEIRNSVYFFDPRPDVPVRRYDKIYLARFSERAPLTLGPAWLRSIALRISANRATQPLHAGSLSELQPFLLHWRETTAATTDTAGDAPAIESSVERESSFIAPICLENIDPAVIARMLRDPDPLRKRADFIANVSNDGWFAAQEKYQHLQTTIFRCIENRVPMVRSSNTGISSFIDSCGRVTNTIAPGTSGFAVQSIQFDKRITFYTRYGDVFPLACVALVVAAVLRRLTLRILAFARQTRAPA